MAKSPSVLRAIALQVNRYWDKHPDATTKQVCEALGIPKSYVDRARVRRIKDGKMKPPPRARHWDGSSPPDP